MLQSIVAPLLPLNKLLFVDVEGHTANIRYNPNLAVYFVGLLLVDEGKNKVERYTDVDFAIKRIQELLDTGWTMVCHNAKFDYSCLKSRGLKWTITQGQLSIACTQVMAYTRASNLESYSLDGLTGMKTDIVQVCVDAGLIPNPGRPLTDKDKKEFWQTDWSDNEPVLKLIADYCIDDLKATHKLYKRLATWYNLPENQRFISTLLWLEFPMLEVLCELELSGLYVSSDRLNDLTFDLQTQLTSAHDTLRKETYALPQLKWNAEADEYQPFEKTYAKGYYKNAKVNISHYMDAVGVVCASAPYLVYDHCPLVPYNPAAATGHNWWLLKQQCPDVLSSAEKTKKGKPQLNKDFVADIADQLPEGLPLARILKLTKALQMTTTLAEHVQIDNRIHCSFANCRTRTGRLATSEPNLQNIPRSSDDPESVGSKFRQLFTAPPGKRILVADLDRIEITVLAWFLSRVLKDNSLLDVCNTGADVHQSNAERWNVSRSVAKTLIFLLVYGGGANLIFRRGMSKTLEEAESMVKQVDESQPTIQQLKELVWDKASKRGYVTNPYNCRGVYPELYENNKWKRFRGQRQAFNYLIQRTARDIIHWLCIESLSVIRSHGGKLVDLIHDECVVEVDEENAEALKQALNKLWQDRRDLLPGIKVNGDWNIGGSWYEAK